VSTDGSSSLPMVLGRLPRSTSFATVPRSLQLVVEEEGPSMETSAAVALVAWIAVAAPRSPAQDGAAPPAGAKELTLEQTMGPNRVSFGSPPPPVAFAKDGVHLEVQRDGKTVWHDPKTQATSEPPPADPKAKAEADAKEAALVAALAKANGLDEEKAKRVVRSRLAASSDGKTLLFTEGGDLYLVQVGKEKGERLTTTPAPEENARLSPDGRHVSFVRSNDLYLIGTDTLRERAVTKDGAVEKSERLNGKLDWVYQEEVYGRGNFQATWWSPDSKHLAFLALDETGVPHHPIVDHMPSRAELEDTRYPKAGDPNPKVALGVARASDGHVTWVDLAKYAQDEPIVVRVGWTPKGDRVCFQVVGRRARRAALARRRVVPLAQRADRLQAPLPLRREGQAARRGDERRVGGA
jgi:dipeptidyl-peptidase-4